MVECCQIVGEQKKEARQLPSTVLLLSLVLLLVPSVRSTKTLYAISHLANHSRFSSIAGGLITQNTTWRWVFWGTSILDAFVQLLATLFLNETYPPAILAKKVLRLKRETGNQDLRTKWQNPNHTFAMVLRKNLVRPFIMLGTQPTIQVLALYRGVVYGLMYLVLSTFPFVFGEVYGMSIGDASLNYISLGVGFVVGLQICAPIIDRVSHLLLSPIPYIEFYLSWLSLNSH